MSRRNFLQLGSIGAATLGLSGIEQARALSQANNESSSDTAVIFVWLPGGPPHMETYDMKPDAPADYRGEFKPIRTNVTGIDVCELLPLHAKCADKYTLIRSVHHTFSDHGGGHKRFLTGRKPKTPTGFVNDAPMVGSMASKALGQTRTTNGLSNYMVLGNGRVNGIDTFSFGSAYLDKATHPFIVSGDPSSPKFKIKNLSLREGFTSERLNKRASLLSQLDRLNKQADATGEMAGIDAMNQKAIAMITSTKTREAFDLSKEPEKLRDRYGRHLWGQHALTARRLVEAGVSWVTVVMENPYESGIKMPKYGTYNWDSHAVNCHLFDDARLRLPIYDKVITALIEDIHNRGLNKKVLLVVTGEFGRTPRINESKGSSSKVVQPGRNHWPRAMSMLVSGGGMQTGQVVGSTNAKGEEPVNRPLSPNDLWATVYQHLGVDYNMSFLDHSGRPMPILPHGEPIAELIRST
jgi:hypothetical protein